jgi:hypothetical protein
MGRVGGQSCEGNREKGVVMEINKTQVLVI